MADPAHSETHTQPLSDGDLATRSGDGPQVALLVLHPAEPRMTILTAGRGVVVGRKAPAHVTLADAALSREHARFTLDGDGRAVLVEDLGSTNGTWIAGARAASGRVAIGDGVRLGGIAVQIERLPGGGADVPKAIALGGATSVGAAMKDLVDRLPLIAASNAAVLLHGETGTGKEVLARAIHDAGPRRRGPLVRVNCGAIPQALVESTLFGHEKGAFTGAIQQRRGVFEDAQGGTVLLDEIGELPLPAQAALLRVLETKQITRVGATREIAVDVRIVSATHRDLEAMGREGTFRADLFYRLSTVVLRVPPLRERRDEIEPLAIRFLADAAKSSGRALRGLDAAALALLESYAFPGNIRELKNAIEHAAVFARDGRIGALDLPERIRRAAPAAPEAAPSLAAAPPDTAAPSSGNISPATARSADDPDGSSSKATDAAMRGRVHEYEAQIIRDALDATGWKRAEAAARLGLPVRTLSYRMKVLGVARDKE